MVDRSDHITLPSLGRLSRYLRADNWLETKISDRHAVLYRKTIPDLGMTEIVLPSGDRPGLDTAVAQAIRTLASIEAIDVREVARRVWAISFDIIETIIPSHRMFLDSISLELAEQTLRSTRRILSRNAQAELNTTAGIHSDASDFLSSCKFAHTFSSSFGFRVESPIGPNPEDDLTKQPMPFERRVTERLARGMRSLETAANESDPRSLVDNIERGFDGLTCGAIVAFLEETRISEFRMNCIFSKAWETAPDLTHFVSVNIKDKIIPVLKEAQSSLKDKEIFESMTVQGRVVGLSSKHLPDDLNNPEGREVTISFRNSDDREQRIHVNLSPEDYMYALQAHVRGHEFAVVGRARKVGRQLKMEQATRLFKTSDANTIFIGN